jgi:hypothetical protein
LSESPLGHTPVCLPGHPGNHDDVLACSEILKTLPGMAVNHRRSPGACNTTVAAARSHYHLLGVPLPAAGGGPALGPGLRLVAPALRLACQAARRWAAMTVSSSFWIQIRVPLPLRIQPSSATASRLRLPVLVFARRWTVTVEPEPRHGVTRSRQNRRWPQAQSGSR